MTASHTPGPWMVIESRGDADVPSGCSLAIDDEFGQDGGRDYYLATVVHGDPDELRANAALIAAAPELLEILQTIVARATRPVPDSTGQSMVSIRLALLDKARAAIAAATTTEER